MTRIGRDNLRLDLYAIIDKAWLRDRKIEELAEALLEGGANVLQLRDKTSPAGVMCAEARVLQKLTQRYGVPLIINDRLDVALAVEADGVHLGQDDLPFDAARRIAGREFIIGGSVSNWEEARRALSTELDYLGVGAMFATGTKEDAVVCGPGFLRELRKVTNLPLVAIGGITLENLEPVIEAGADGVAVISDLLGASDVRTRARAYVEKIQKLRSQTVRK